MKNVLTFVCLSFLMVNDLQSQSPILSKKDADFLLKTGYTIYRKEKVNLRLRSDKMLDLLLEKGEYIIIAITENGVKDIDAYLLNQDNVLLSKDTDYQDGGVAYLTTTILQKQPITIRLKVYEAWCEDCMYGTEVLVYWRVVEEGKE